jgi:DNA-binding NarL/FixJ family response regulator
MSAPRAIRVLLADDHALVRAGLKRILDAERGVTVVGEVEDGAAALAALKASAVDVLVLDLSMPGVDGFGVLAKAKTIRPDLKILVLTMHADAEYVARAVREGADGYLLKDSAVTDLVAGVRSVSEGKAYFTPRIQQELTALLRSKPEPGPLESLTDRELEVLKLVAEGLATKEIAARLDISTRTVETHRANLMRKLDVHSIARLVQIAIREGLVSPP